MSDIALIWNPDEGRAELALAANDLTADEGLETAILLSLFTDRRAEPGDVLPDVQTDRRGWWADSTVDKFGSRLWLLGRAKNTAEHRQRAKDYVTEALAWLVEDKAAQRIDVGADIGANGILNLTITVVRPGGTDSRFRYAYNWAAQAAAGS